MSDDEEILFQQEMAGVRRLQLTERMPRKPGETSAESLARRRAAAIQAEVDLNPLSEEGIEPLDPWYVLDFKRPGVQNGVFRKLKQGRYEAEARLNLHRMPVKQAREELFGFIGQAQELGLRTVLVIHGKGENSPERQQASIIKGCVAHWLRELEAVQAYHSARPQHGGTGAAYILLRKSEAQKQENRERFR
jgi:DNA-nicking Smr family endonuclease